MKEELRVCWTESYPLKAALFTPRGTIQLCDQRLGKPSQSTTSRASQTWRRLCASRVSKPVPIEKRKSFMKRDEHRAFPRSKPLASAAT